MDKTTIPIGLTYTVLYRRWCADARPCHLQTERYGFTYWITFGPYFGCECVVIPKLTEASEEEMMYYSTSAVLDGDIRTHDACIADVGGFNSVKERPHAVGEMRRYQTRSAITALTTKLLSADHCNPYSDFQSEYGNRKLDGLGG